MGDEQVCSMVAHILGPASAAAKALTELARRRELGEDVAVRHTHRSWVVMPAQEVP